MSRQCPMCFAPLPESVAPLAQCPRCKKALSHSAPTALELIYLKTGDVIRLEPAEDGVVGREAKGAEVLMKVAQISRRHCRFECLGNAVWAVVDLDSTHGTFVGAGGRRVNSTTRVPLAEGDQLRLGQEVFAVRFVQAPSTPGPLEKEAVGTLPKVLTLRRCRECGETLNQGDDVCGNGHHNG